MEKLIKELIAVEKKRNSLLVELNENLKKLTSKEDKYEFLRSLNVYGKGSAGNTTIQHISRGTDSGKKQVRSLYCSIQESKER